MIYICSSLYYCSVCLLYFMLNFIHFKSLLGCSFRSFIWVQVFFFNFSLNALVVFSYLLVPLCKFIHLSKPLKMSASFCSFAVYLRYGTKSTVNTSGPNWVAEYWGNNWLCYHIDASTGVSLGSMASHSFQGIPSDRASPQCHMPSHCQTSWNHVETAFVSGINYALGPGQPDRNHYGMSSSDSCLPGPS